MAGAVGAGVAVVTFLLLATIVSCICCPQCPNYDKSSTFQKQHKRNDTDQRRMGRKLRKFLIEITSRPVDQKKLVRVRLTTPKN